ncbi:Zn-dependent hydrolase [Idiomarina seosinensis]|uniref:dipeptidyl-peptidase 3 family protein n=1 Tax=Idiomarina seosinensis TaxID=281739 RepID=UPI00384F2112
MLTKLVFLIPLIATLAACSDDSSTAETRTSEAVSENTDNQYQLVSGAEDRFDIYTRNSLNSDLGHLSAKQKRMIGLLIQASQIMDNLFWQQAFTGNHSEFLAALPDSAVNFAEINYGPWDRLQNDAPFIAEFGEKPAGANFYPTDMDKQEFNRLEDPDKDSLYTLIRRNDSNELLSTPYSQAYPKQLKNAAGLLRRAADLAENHAFANYLRLRADAFLSDQYRASDLAWVELKDNAVDIIIGPIETYEDQLFGYKAAFESYVLIKDPDWSQRLAQYTQYLPALQRNLPVTEAYKAETPGSEAQLGVYDAIYYAGRSNAGSKTIAVNLPNDEQVQLQKGTRRLQLKNAMRAKFDQIMMPIAEQLVVPEQRKHVTFDAFFANTLFHEIAHGLGIKNTINGKGSVRSALKEHSSALEEGKADVLGLYMITQLYEQGHLQAGQLEDYYVTFMASIFRSVRFGASSAHGKANMIRFNYFANENAFTRNAEGQYGINMGQMRRAMNSLSKKILMLQGDGDYQAVAALVQQLGVINSQLQTDLDALQENDIPVDIQFNQGKQVLGLN